MLKNYSKQVMVTANIEVEAADGRRIVEYLSASIPESGNYSINQSVQDKDLYYKNLEEIRADEDGFKASVDEIARGMARDKE